MKFTHENSWFYKFPNDQFLVEYSFANVLDTGDTVASFTASIYDVDGDDKTASMISSTQVSSPYVYFKVGDGTANKTYNIKIAGQTTLNKTYVYYLNCEVFGETVFNTKLGDSSNNSYVTLEEANDYIRSTYGHNSKWDTLSEEGKKRVLVEAGREINAFNFRGEKYYSTQGMEFPRDTHEVITGNCATPITINSFSNTRLKSSTYGRYPTDYWKYGTCHITSGTPVYDIRNIDNSHTVTGVITTADDFSATPTENTQFVVFAPIHKDIKFAQCEQAISIIDNSDTTSLQKYRNLGADSVTIGEVSVRFGSGGMFTGSKGVVIAPSTNKLLSRFIRKNIRIWRA